MPTKAMGIGSDAAMNWFDSNIEPTCPMFSVYSGGNILFSYCKMDLEESRTHFENNINALIQNGFNDILTLRTHLTESKKPILFITNKLPTTSSFFWRPVELNRPFFDNSSSEYRMDGQETLKSKVARLEEKIELGLLKKEDEDDDDEDESIAGINPQNNLFSFLNTLLQNEQIQNAIVGKILNLITPSTTPKVAGINSFQNNNIQPMANLTEEEAQICLHSISILKQVKPDVVKDLQTLATIAQTDVQKCNFILSMLPK